MTTTWHVRWETVAGPGSRAFGTEAEALAWVAELGAAGLGGAWVYAAWSE